MGAPLREACEQIDSAAALGLIGRGADVDCVDERGYSPLMFASIVEELDCVAARLIAAGAKLNLVDSSGNSPLSMACACKRAATALLLVEAGAALNKVDSKYAKSALDWADEQGLEAVSAAIRAYGGRTGVELKLVAEQGERDKVARAALGPAEARAKGEQLLEAARQASIKTPGEAAKPFIAAALRLISEGADPDCLYEQGWLGYWSPLMFVSGYRELDRVATRLIAAGAMLDLVNAQGNSALILACQKEHAATALLLVEAGAALNQINSYSKTALDEANENGLAAVAAAIRARDGRTGEALQLEAAAHDAPTNAAAGALAKAARTALGPEAARARGEQLLAVCRNARKDAAAALRLISEGADPDCTDDEGNSSLMLASKCGALSSVAARLVAAGAKLDLVDKGGDSALINACFYRHAATALLLVEAGALLDQVGTDTGMTALDWADEMGLAAVAAAIRARGGRTGPEIDARGNGGKLLLRACCNSDAVSALRLISAGADPDCIERDGRSPLMEASCSEELDGVAARLIAAGAKLDFVDVNGDSALILACSGERAATALLLIEAGAALNQVNDEGKSALDEAGEKGLAAVSAAIRARNGRSCEALQLEASARDAPAHAAAGALAMAARAVLAPAAIVAKGEQLLEAAYQAWCRSPGEAAKPFAADALRLISEGAGRNCINKDGNSTLMLASQCGELDGVAARLVAAGATLDLVNKSGTSALMLACRHRRAATAMLLVKASAKLDQVDKNDGKTALDYAEEKCLAAVAAAIRARGGRTGLEIDARGNGGKQLFLACKRYDAASALRLISGGADLDCADERGWSPLMCASRSEELDGVAARLVAAGAKLNLVEKCGQSALIVACSNERAATALLLIEAGAALNQVGGDDRSALDKANEKGLAAVSAAIRARGGRTSLEIDAHGIGGRQLLAACTRKDAAAALRLISEGAGLDCVGEHGWTPLIHACFYEKLDAVAARLVEAGAKLNLVDSWGRPALIIACTCTRAATALLLVESGAALNHVDNAGKSALTWADEKGLASVAAAIRARGGRTSAELKAEAVQNERDKAARAALGPVAARAKGEKLLAACGCDDAAAALQLISEGADPDYVDGEGWSPLIFASCKEELDGVAARLIAAGAKLDLVSKRGNSALILACINKRTATALLLVEARAALNQVDDKGKSALDYAGENGLEALHNILRVRGGRTGDKIRVLLPPGEQLLWACKSTNAAAALRLISEGADPDCVDVIGRSPLILASREEELAGVAARLVAAGAKLNLVSENGDTALIWACYKKCAATALLLVEAGAALNQVATDDGKSALDYADENGLAVMSAAIRARGGRTGLEIDAHGNGGKQLRTALSRKDFATAMLLVEAGAALNQVGGDDKSALDLANEEGAAAVSAAIRARGGRTSAALKSEAAQGERDKAARAALGPAVARARGEQLLAACKRKDAAAALRLISEGADPDCVDEDGCSPLMVAGMYKELSSVAACLIAAGASLSVASKSGNTAAILACYSSCAATALLLVDAGAALNSLGYDDKSALDWANDMGLRAVAAAIRARGGRTASQIMAELAAAKEEEAVRTAGAQAKAARAALGPAAARAKGELLLMAARQAYLEAPDEAAKPFIADALRLINKGADLDCTDDEGNSPLMWTSCEEALDGVAAHLIAAGARIDLVDEGSMSALFNACTYKRAATAMLLVEAGAALNQVDGGGRSALDWADEKGLAAVVDAIRARGGRAGAELKVSAAAAVAAGAEGGASGGAGGGAGSSAVGGAGGGAGGGENDEVLAHGLQVGGYAAVGTAALCAVAAAKADAPAAAAAAADGLAALAVVGARDKAARAALGPAAARAKGEQLLTACLYPFDVAAALRLISEGADPSCVDRDGWSPLMIASQYEELDAVAAHLIAAGAKLDLVHKSGDSALIFACFCKRAATALLLIEAGAALNQVGNDGKSALDCADVKGLAAVAAAIRARGGRSGAELKAGATSRDCCLT